MNRLQIDDPLPTCMFPVVFAPVPPPKSIAGDREPIAFIQASVVMQRGSGQLILFKYAKVTTLGFSLAKRDLRITSNFSNLVVAGFDQRATL